MDALKEFAQSKRLPLICATAVLHAIAAGWFIAIVMDPQHCVYDFCDHLFVVSIALDCYGILGLFVYMAVNVRAVRPLHDLITLGSMVVVAVCVLIVYRHDDDPELCTAFDDFEKPCSPATLSLWLLASWTYRFAALAVLVGHVGEHWVNYTPVLFFLDNVAETYLPPPPKDTEPPDTHALFV